MKIELDDQELSTVLAALRLYQDQGLGSPANRSEAIHEIATNGGEIVSLDTDGIDELCEKLNTTGGDMSPEKVWGALEFYDRELEARGCFANQFTPAMYASKNPVVAFGLSSLLDHCRWMTKQCEFVFKERGTQSELEKAMRWLGYIQGVCNAIGIYSCDELRDHSRTGGGTAKTEEFKSAVEEHGTVPPVPRLTDEQLDRARIDAPPEMRMTLYGMSPERFQANQAPPLPIDQLTEPQFDAAIAEGRFDTVQVVPPYPCCEGVRRIEREPGKAETLQGGWCPVHGLSLVAPARPEAGDERYARLEKEHLGDPDKKTGIYDPNLVKHRTQTRTEESKSLRWSSENPPTSNIPPRPTEEACSEDGTPK